MNQDESTVELRWARWRVSGQVQGVGFRGFVQRAAQDQAVVGDVCNLSDGRVEIRARGSAQELESLLAAVQEGPHGARVEQVETLAPEPADEVLDFVIRHPDGE